MGFGSRLGTCGAVGQPNCGQNGALRTNVDVGPGGAGAESFACGVGQGDGGHARGSCPGIGLGVGGGGWGPRPWRAMTVAMLSAVRATSVTFMAPWQLGHTEMSTRKTRLSSHCHGWRPGFRVGASGSGGGAGR